jgi:hypothetical protein
MKTSIKFYLSPRSTKGAIQAAIDVCERWLPPSDKIAGVALATIKQACTPFNKPQPPTVEYAPWNNLYPIVTASVHGNLSLSDFTLFHIQTLTIQELEKQRRSVRDKFDSLNRRRKSGCGAECLCHLIPAIPEVQNACGLAGNWVRESPA